MDLNLIKDHTVKLKSSEKGIKPIKIYNDKIFCVGDKGIFVYVNNRLIKIFSNNIIGVLSKPFEACSEKLLFVSLKKINEHFHIHLNEYNYQSNFNDVLIDIKTIYTTKEDAYRCYLCGDIYFRYLNKSNIFYGHRKPDFLSGVEIYSKQYNLPNNLDTLYYNHILKLDTRQLVNLPQINFKVGNIALIEHKIYTFLVFEGNNFSRWEKRQIVEYNKNYQDNKVNELNRFDNLQVIKSSIGIMGLSSAEKLIIENCNENQMINIINTFCEEIIYELVDFSKDDNYLVYYNILTEEKKTVKISRKYNSIIIKANEDFYFFDGDKHYTYLRNITNHMKDLKFPLELGNFQMFINKEYIITFNLGNLTSYIYNLTTENYIEIKGFLYYSKTDNQFINVL